MTQTKQDPSLVVVQLSGGNDYLNTVVRYNDGLYRDFRPHVRIEPDEVLKIDDEVGFHPSMGPIKKLWDEGKVAIINGIGYPNPNRSHFRSMDIWHTAEPDKVGREGWLGRVIRELDPKGENVLTGVNFGRGLPRALGCQEVSVASVGDLSTYGLYPDLEDEAMRKYALEAFAKMYGEGEGRDAVSDFLGQTGISVLKGADLLRSGATKYSSSVEYAASPISQSLKSAAQVMFADLGTRIYYTQHGSFDTHAGELELHAKLWQVVVSYGPQASASEINEMLGNTTAAHQIALETVQNTLQGKTSAAISAINRGILEGVDLRHLHHQVIEITRSVLLIQCGSRDALELPSETIKYLDPLASKVSIQRVVDTLKLIGEINLRYDAPSPLPLELAVVEASLKNTPLTKNSTVSAVAPSGDQDPTPNASLKNQPAKSITKPSSIHKDGVVEPTQIQDQDSTPNASLKNQPAKSITKSPSIHKDGVVEPTQIPTSENAQKSEPESIHESEIPEEQWNSLVKVLNRIKGKRFNIGALLRDCKSPYLVNNTLVLNFLHRSHLERMQEELENPMSQRLLDQHLEQVMGHNYKVKLILNEGDSANNSPIHNNSPLVRAALTMGARIVKEKEKK